MLRAGLLLLVGASSALRVGLPAGRHGCGRTASARCALATDAPPSPSAAAAAAPDAISAQNPMHVLIAGAGVGGLALANCLEASDAPITYTILERTQDFKKFGGPIQLAS